MATQLETVFRERLATRRQNLEAAITATSAPDVYLSNLLQEVDAALSRIDGGSFGLCEVCHEPIESDRLSSDPLVRFCVDHLTPPQQQALQQDLDLASQIQVGLLPQHDLAHSGWQAAFHYEPAGPVSGDYCDLVTAENGDLYFMFGDVCGKGVSAAMLMSHLHALFRALISVALPLDQILARASRVFCESTLSSHYATLVCGKAGKNGDVQLCNAGHLPPLLVHGSNVRSIDATGLPLGMFCSEEFKIDEVRLGRGDLLVLFTDGISEAQDSSGSEFGVHRLIDLAKTQPSAPAREMMRSMVAAASEFRGNAPVKDDLTVMVIERTA